MNPGMSECPNVGRVSSGDLQPDKVFSFLFGENVRQGLLDQFGVDFGVDLGLYFIPFLDSFCT